MQTFLPYPDFARSARVLDRQRLGKQRVETLQIARAVFLGGGWQNHPAVLMWRPSMFTLLDYQEAICNEWTSRGYKDTCLTKTHELYSDFTVISRTPKWLGNKAFHRAHRSNLVRKNPDHYRQFFPNVPDNLPYVWPV